jgi:flagellin-like hook-associated protein FlgL
MASNVTLSAAVRQNLLSLQNTAQLMSQTQNRLATGKKVNSALDNPSNYFTSQSLNNRASDLNSLLDSIGQAQQTLKTADQGITSLTQLVQAAKSIATQARQATGPVASYGAVSASGTLGAETIATHTGSSITATNSTLYSFTVDTGDGNGAQTISYTSDATATVSEIQQGLIDAFNSSSAAANATLSISGNGLKIDANTADTSLVIGAGAGNSGLSANTYSSTSLWDNLSAAGVTAGDTLTVTTNGGSPTTIAFGTGAGQVSTVAELNAALAGTGGTASGTSLSFSVAAASTQTSLSLVSSSAALATGLGLASANVSQNGTQTITTPDSTRASAQNDFNNILSQIDTLAKDSSYNGVNLLYGDNLKVVFNELGTSSQTISGVTFDSAGLGLSAQTGTAFQSNATVDSVIDTLNTALSTLRTQATKFGSNLTTVQTRQDFTKNMVNTLQTGADSLVLADTNEEGANLLALQTRQQLSTTALSLSAQAEQAVMRLFG